MFREVGKLGLALCLPLVVPDRGLAPNLELQTRINAHPWLTTTQRLVLRYLFHIPAPSIMFSERALMAC